VVIGADNADRKLLPGMTADVRIIVGRKDNVLKVPNAALRFAPAERGSEMVRTPSGEDRDASGGAEVWRLGRDGRQHAHPVHTGLTDGVFTEVMDSDLKDGDEVIVGTSQPTSANARVGPLKF